MLLWTDSGKGLDIYRPTCPLTFLGPMSTCAESSPIVAFYLVGFGDGFGHGLQPVNGASNPTGKFHTQVLPQSTTEESTDEECIKPEFLFSIP
ncbi:conserved hypothetical protein [Coccidioides posadasii str. Silveira]|uniref:Uncharacterized protein n=1 Tax=Coccidioides posadasii (strain RMSCC 757 / Silveira) TaxID=443226 RepID=E9DJW3_COCPS|nr:conserved hypothetical protein [Coccidioides posadasii str. Silveira]